MTTTMASRLGSLSLVDRFKQLKTDRLSRTWIQRPGRGDEIVAAELGAVRVRRLGDTIRVQHDEVARMGLMMVRLYETVGNSPSGVPLTCRPLPAGVESNQLHSRRFARYPNAGGWPDSSSRGVLGGRESRRPPWWRSGPVEVSEDRVVEIPHETCLLEGRQVRVHQFAKLDTQRSNGAPVTTHIGESDARDDAARTDGDVVHVPPGFLRPEGT